MPEKDYRKTRTRMDSIPQEEMSGVNTEIATDLMHLAANTIRMLAADGVQKANSGHPGMPMGMADCALILWTRFLKYFPKDSEWMNRDRFILSAGHGSMLLYTMLHLGGYDVSLDDLKNFRQWGSKTPGHPEFGCLPGVETTTGPLGQGFSNGVGMAIAAKIMAEQFNTADFAILGTHHIYGIVSDGDLMEGVSSEAASIAGHLGLGNIIYFYDDNQITIEGNTGLTFSEDVEARFRSYGWHTVRIDGHNHDQITAAIEEGIAEKDRPTLILTKTHIGYGSPHKQDTSGVHGAPLGVDELKETKRHLGLPEDKEFFVPAEVKDLFQGRVQTLEKEYWQWNRDFELWREKHPDLSEKFNLFLTNSVPENIETTLLDAFSDEPDATRSISGKVMQKIADLVPNFYGGSADLAPSTNTYLKKYAAISPRHFEGRNFHFGIREHAMGGILNGIALYGGFIPFGATFFVFSDYMRPSIRLAAITGLQVVYVFTHDSIFVGEDGPTHQPVEQLAALRAIPNLTVIRPADGVETAMAWGYALKNKKNPSALILTRQKVTPLERPADFDPYLVQKGGYVISKEKNTSADVILIASGSEVEVALNASKLLQEDGLSVRVVSLPSIELFKAQDAEYRQSVIPGDLTPCVVVEAGISQGWGDLLHRPFLMIGMDHFGASGPYQILAEKFGFTAKNVHVRVTEWMSANNTK